MKRFDKGKRDQTENGFLGGGLFLGIIGGWAAYILFSDAEIRWSWSWGFLQSGLWASLKGVASWFTCLFFGSLIGALVGMAGAKLFLRKGDLAAEEEKAGIEAVRLTDRKASALQNRCHPGSALPEELLARISVTLKLCSKLRVFVAEPDHLENEWMDPSFRSECLSMTASIIDSLEHLYQKYELWLAKGIPAAKIQPHLEKDENQLGELSEELESVISDAQDIAVKQSSDWAQVMGAVAACRSYADVWKGSPLV